MATKSSKAIQPNNSTDAAFRAWSKFIFDGMIAGGWVQTADTGQINFATVTRPLAGNTARGYIIVRMDGSLQSTVPVYMRMDFGSGGSAAVMGVWVTLGPSSTGAGVINTPWLSNPTSGAALVQTASSSSAMVQPYSFISADTDRVHFVIGVNAAASTICILMSLERTKSASGNADGTGLLFYYSGSGGALNRNQYLFAADVPQPPVEQGTVAILPIRNTGVTSQNWGIGIPTPFAGLSQQPGLGVLITQSLDATNYGRFGIDVYGDRVVYQALFSVRATGFGRDGTTVVLMRFD